MRTREYFDIYFNLYFFETVLYFQKKADFISIVIGLALFSVDFEMEQVLWSIAAQNNNNKPRYDDF